MRDQKSIFAETDIDEDGDSGALKRADLARRVQEMTGGSRARARSLVDLMLNEISDCLVNGEDVKLSGFGVFQVRSKNQRIGRNPRTGEEVPIDPRRVVTFKASPNFKSAVNGETAPTVRSTRPRRKKSDAA